MVNSRAIAAGIPVLQGGEDVNGPYRRSAKAADRVASAKQLARMVLASDGLLLTHKKQMLDKAIWWISEADGKHKTRHRSAECLRLALEEPNSNVKIQHEHVFERKDVIATILSRREELLANPALLDAILDETVGCVVTEDEHDRLESGHGWARYIAAKVVVLDMSTLPPTVWQPPIPIPPAEETP